MAVLFLLLLLFFSLVWSLWLWFPIICWINVALVGTHHLLPNLREKAFSFSSSSIYVSDVFIVYSLYSLEVYFLYTNFVERFYHKGMLDDMVSWVICMFSSPSSPSTSLLSWLFSKCEEYIIKYWSFKMWTVLRKYKHATFYCSLPIVFFTNWRIVTIMRMASLLVPFSQQLFLT